MFKDGADADEDDEEAAEAPKPSLPAEGQFYRVVLDVLPSFHSECVEVIDSQRTVATRNLQPIIGKNF